MVTKPPFIVKQLSLLLLICIATLQFGCGLSKKVTKNTHIGVKFIKNETLANVLAQAKAQKKLVFVDVYTTWCLPCKVMDQEVFTQPSTISYLNDNFIAYKVDAEKGTGGAVSLMYEVEAYPTLLFLDEKGTVLQKREGGATPDQLYNMGERAKAQAQQ
jgi:thioredoxin 1